MKNQPSTKPPSLYLWRGDREAARPVLVECPDGGWPASDADGIKIFENSHFADREAAWKWLLDESAAGVSLAGRSVAGARKELMRLEQRAADKAVFFARVRENRPAGDS